MGGFADQKGNKYIFEMSEDDMVNDAKQAVTLFRQHANDPKLVASMGPTNSVGFLPCIPIAGISMVPVDRIDAGDVCAALPPIAST